MCFAHVQVSYTVTGHFIKNNLKAAGSLPSSFCFAASKDTLTQRPLLPRLVDFLHTVRGVRMGIINL